MKNKLSLVLVLVIITITIAFIVNVVATRPTPSHTVYGAAVKRICPITGKPEWVTTANETCNHQPQYVRR